jgi:Uma2 family endonuclease
MAMSMSAGSSKSRATYADLLEVPEHLVAEIVDGELHTSPRPALRHSNATSVLGTQLGGPFHIGRGGPGGWWILDEPELHFGDDVLVPDLAGWRRERLPRLPDAPAISLAPDWVCEALSPSTRRLDRGKKLSVYARERVGHAWLMDADARTLEVYRRSPEGWLLVATHEGDAGVQAEPFEAVEIALALLWGDVASGESPAGR